jgi:hypothetical protein
VHVHYTVTVQGQYFYYIHMLFTCFRREHRASYSGFHCSVLFFLSTLFFPLFIFFFPLSTIGTSFWRQVLFLIFSHIQSSAGFLHLFHSLPCPIHPIHSIHSIIIQTQRLGIQQLKHPPNLTYSFVDALPGIPYAQPLPDAITITHTGLQVVYERSFDHSLLLSLVLSHIWSPNWPTNQVSLSILLTKLLRTIPF